MLKLCAIHGDEWQRDVRQEDVPGFLWCTGALHQGLRKAFCVCLGLLDVHQSCLLRNQAKVVVCIQSSLPDVLQCYPNHSDEWLEILCHVRRVQCCPRGYAWRLMPVSLGHSRCLNQCNKRPSHQNGQGQCKELGAALCHGAGLHKLFWHMRMTPNSTHYI